MVDVAKQVKKDTRATLAQGLFKAAAVTAAGRLARATLQNDIEVRLTMDHIRLGGCFATVNELVSYEIAYKADAYTHLTPSHFATLELILNLFSLRRTPHVIHSEGPSAFPVKL